MIIFEEIFARDSIVLCQIKFLTSQVSKKKLFVSSLIFFGTQHTRNPWGLSKTNLNWWFRNSGIWLRFLNLKVKEPDHYSEGIRWLQFSWGISNSLVSWWRMVYDTSFRRADSYNCYFLMSTTGLSRRHVSKHLMNPASNSKF